MTALVTNNLKPQCIVDLYLVVKIKLHKILACRYSFFQINMSKEVEKVVAA